MQKLLIVLIIFAQGLPVAPLSIPTPKLGPMRPPLVTVPVVYTGDVHVPAAQGKAIVWRHIIRRFPPNRLNPRSLTVWIQNVTHPISDGLGLHLKEDEAYDPRNVRITTHYLSFDAPAGDYILWRVGGTSLP